MENQKTNLTTAAKRGNLTSHQMTVCKTSTTDMETGQGNFQVATPLGTRSPWTKGRFQLSQRIAIRNTLVSTGLPGGIDETANTENVVWGVKHYDWPGVTGWPFCAKHQPSRCQREQQQNINFRRRGGQKGNVVFLELRDCVYKGSKGPARHFGSQNKWRNYYCRGTKYEKGRGK